MNLLAAIYWFCECVFNAQSIPIQSGVKSANAYSSSFCPFSECKRLAVKGDDSVASSISGLLCLCGPLAIFRRVVAVVIYSFKTHSFRAFAHVIDKVLKRIFPSPAYGYSARPVVWKEHGVLVIAPLLHAVPNRVRSCFSKSVRGGVSCPAFTLKAPARINCAPEVVSRNSFCVSAIANGVPVRLPSVVLMRKRGDNKPSKSMPSHILFKHVNPLKMAAV